jgi:ABC-type transporter Mla subunit MlaD
MQRDPSPPPGERARRRSLFGGRPEPEPRSPTAGLTPSAAERAEVVITAYQEMIQEQLDEGLRSIQHTANTLMHEIAAEVWRSADGDKEAVGATILQELSRDQAIRALIAHSDERFQALAARTGRLEDTMNMLAETVRTAKEQIARSADALAESGGAASPLGVGQIRAQLDEVSRQVTSAFQTLAERDQVILDTVHERIREHSDLIAQETARISEAMQAYVQQGVEAMGRLAGTADSQFEAFTFMEEQTGDRVRETVEQQIAQLGEQLQLLYDRTGIAVSSLHESVSYLGDRIGVETRDRMSEMNRAFESRVMGLANLVRSDAETLRREIVRSAQSHDETLARTLDERLAGVADRITETIVESVTERIESSMSELATRSEEQTRLIDERTGEAVSAIDRNVVRMVDSMEEHFDRLGQNVGQRAGTAAELAIGARFDDVLARMHEATAKIEHESSQTRGAIAEARGAITQTQGIMSESRETFEQGVSALAKLVRSDSETLARQIVADQDVSKQALRAMKELQASLPTEVIQMVEERFGSLAESIERSNEMLAARIDRMADTIGQRQNDDIQIVIDRMGDAMHALASLGKGDGPPRSTPRIEID